MTDYKHIIWDWNGTLMDDAWYCVETINKILAKYHKPALSLQRYRNIFDFPVRDYYQKIGFDFSEHPFEIVGTEFIQEYKKDWQKCGLHADAIKVLSEISTAKKSQSIISAADIDLLDAFVSHYNVADLFITWRGLNHHFATSKADIARQFMQEYGYDPNDVLLIGDTTHDFAVAQAINVDCILFTNGHQSVAKLKKCEVPMIDGLSKVLGILNSEENGLGINHH